MYENTQFSLGSFCLLRVGARRAMHSGEKLETSPKDKSSTYKMRALTSHIIRYRLI